MSDKIHAPFTERQAQALNRFQVARQFHPFTCPREHLSSSDSLIAVAGQGWVCPSAQCDYTQDWAHAFMAEVQIKPRWTDLIGIDPDYLKDASYLRLTSAEDDISWAGLMELLDEHWPVDLFPTLEDDPERDAGARIVSLLRWVDQLRAQERTTHTVRYQVDINGDIHDTAQAIARRVTISDHIKDVEWTDEMAHLRRTILFLSLAGICASWAIGMFVWWAIS